MLHTASASGLTLVTLGS